MQHIKRIFRLYRVVIIEGAVTILAVCAIFLGVVPTLQKSVDLAGHMQVLTSDVATLNEKSLILQDEDVTTLQNDLSVLASAVPPDKSLATAMSTLDSVASQSGVTLSNFELAKPGTLATGSAERLTADESKIGSYTLPISVAVTGSLGQVQSFIQTISGARRFMRISSLTLTLYGSGAQAQIELEAFYMPYPTTVGSIDQPISDLTTGDKNVIERTQQLPLFAQSVVVQTTPVSVSSGKADPFSR